MMLNVDSIALEIRDESINGKLVLVLKCASFFKCQKIVVL